MQVTYQVPKVLTSLAHVESKACVFNGTRTSNALLHSLATVCAYGSGMVLHLLRNDHYLTSASTG